MKQFIVTWTITLEAEDADGAVDSALDAMARGDIHAEVEEVDPEDTVEL